MKSQRISKIKNHVKQIMSTTQVDVSPFPHLIIDNFFPEDVYEDILYYNLFSINKGEDWITKENSKKLKTETPYYLRKQISFNKSLDELDMSINARDFWKDIVTLFLETDWFVNLIIEKYRSYFEIRFGDIINSESFISLFRRELFLQRHDSGYYIGPHTDIPTRVFTCIFAFADREGYEECGTKLLVHNDPLVRCWGNNHYSPDDFITVKLAPYKPNSFLLFFKTRQSFHAVDLITQEVPNQRYGMQFQFYEQGKGVFRDLSQPDLLVMQHHKGEVDFRQMMKRIGQRFIGKA